MLAVQTIAKDLRLRGAPHGVMSSFHHVFWLGDLNYRVDFSDNPETDFRDGRPSRELARTFQDGLERAQAEQTYAPLVQRDQLFAARAAGAAFADCEEAPIQFPPTFQARGRCCLLLFAAFVCLSVRQHLCTACRAAMRCQSSSRQMFLLSVLPDIAWHSTAARACTCICIS
jgi:hypothetical protein